MALDIYVGSFTRYLARDWENPGQRYAREHGIEYNVIKPDSKPEDTVTDPALIQEAVRLWRRALEDGLRSDLPQGLSWDERANAPYYTDRPAWEGYAALMLHAAYTEHPNLSRPLKVMKNWEQDAAFVASRSPDFKSRFSQLLAPTIWLPCDFEFTFETEDVAGNMVMFGSSFALLNQLNQLNAETFRGNDLDLTRWRSEYAQAENNSFGEEARFGLTIFLRHAELSVRH